MVDKRSLQALVRKVSSENDLISLYIPFDSRLDLDKKVKSSTENLDEKLRASILKLALKHFDESEYSAGTMLIFHSPDYKKVFVTQHKFEQKTTVGNRFDIIPLVIAIYRNPRYAILVLNKNKARIFDVNRGNIKEELDAYNVPDPFTDKAGYFKSPSGYGGGISQKKGLSANEISFFKDICLELESFTRRYSTKYVVVITAKTILKTCEELCKGKRFKTYFIKGDYIRSNAQQIFETSDKEFKEKRKEEEEKTIKDIEENLLPIDKVAYNLSDILSALNEHRIQSLYIKEDIGAKEGKECIHCGFLTAKGEKNCPYCNKELTHTHNIYQSLIHRALINSIDINFIQPKIKFRHNKKILAVKRY